MLWLLPFVPIAFILDYFHAPALIVFSASALAVMPLAVLMERATEVLSSYLGPTYGGLLSATMGNAPELIIGISALNHGLVDMLKGSIAGSIIGTLLFGLGVTMIAGGMRRPEQVFDSNMVRSNSTLLLIATFGLIIPAVYTGTHDVNVEISLEISVVLLLMYLLALVYTLTTKRQTVGLGAAESELEQHHQLKPGDRKAIAEVAAAPHWSRNVALGVLALVAVAIALVSDLLTGSLQPTADALGLTPLFAGVFMLAMVGNVPQYMNSVAFARKDQMTLALSINLGATTQLVLLVAPVLVITAYFLGKPMNLQFGKFELVGAILAVFLARSLIQDNRSNWAEGSMLLGVYIMLAIGFYNMP